MTTLERILDAIEVIATEADYVYDAINKIDNSASQKSETIANVVAEREQTNRELISFYERILDSFDWEDFDTDFEDLDDEDF